jgi:hypothetical protein
MMSNVFLKHHGADISTKQRWFCVLCFLHMFWVSNCRFIVTEQASFQLYYMHNKKIDGS